MEKMDTNQEDTIIIQNIPIPPSPQVVKSSNEILCELFGAFNATPPPLDDTLSHNNPSNSLQKYKKKHKKHSKKKHKKVKRRKRSSSSSSSSCKSIKSIAKKNKKDKSKVSKTKSDSSKKKKKRKLGRFSASDSDSDRDEPRTKRNKCIHDKVIARLQDCDTIKIKKEKDNDSANLGFSVIPDSLKENLLKHAVSKIVDKVIDSTKLAKGACNNIACMQVTNINLSNEVLQNTCTTVKKEPTDNVQFLNKELKRNKEPISLSKLETSEVPTKPLPVADVFAEDLLDCGISKDSAVVSDKLKSSGGKITIKNLKFSQLYEATVKQIEEEAKLKAEKYEEGELSDSSPEEQDRSPTPSESSMPESLKDLGKTKHLAEKERSRKCCRRKMKKHLRRQSSDRKRSVSKERCQSHSSRSHSHSHHHKEAHRTRSRDRKRSRSKERTKDVSRDRSESNAKDEGKSRCRRRSRDKSSEKCQSKERKRSKDRVKDRTDNAQESSEKNKRKRSDSRERDKRCPEEKIDKQKLLEIARKNALNRMKIPPGKLPDKTKVAITAGGKTVNELTDFCKLLSQKDADGHDSISSNTSNSSDSESEKAFHHPFQLKDRPSSIVLNIRNSVALPVKSHQEKTAESSRQLRLQFPVSSGQQHRKTESEWIPVSPKKTESIPVNMQVAVIKPTTTRQPRVFKDTPEPPSMDIGSIVSQRLTAIRRLQENPTDAEALTQMYKAQQNMKSWAESKQEAPGQFTGSTGVKVLSPAELASGQQAWARRDQLQSAAPVSSGMGMTLLQKMGWKPGEGLGKNKEGSLQPLLLEVKMDKKGLVAQEELPVRQSQQVGRGPALKSLEGKHPVSLLNEYCSRRKFTPPNFELVDEVGPDHKKNFLFKVRVNGLEYQPAVGSPKKKQARMEAAEVCLKAMGILPK